MLTAVTTKAADFFNMATYIIFPNVNGMEIMHALELIIPVILQ